MTAYGGLITMMPNPQRIRNVKVGYTSTNFDYYLCQDGVEKKIPITFRREEGNARFILGGCIEKSGLALSKDLKNNPNRWIGACARGEDPNKSLLAWTDDYYEKYSYDVGDFEVKFCDKNADNDEYKREYKIYAFKSACIKCYASYPVHYDERVAVNNMYDCRTIKIDNALVTEFKQFQLLKSTVHHDHQLIKINDYYFLIDPYERWYLLGSDNTMQDIRNITEKVNSQSGFLYTGDTREYRVDSVVRRISKLADWLQNQYNLVL